MTLEELQNSEGRRYKTIMIFYDEKWKKIDFLEDIRPVYWISSYGRVYNESTGYTLEGNITDRGYIMYSFYTNSGKRIYEYGHRLVMMAFNPIENYSDLVVNHIDGKKTHNEESNLEWVTQKENVEHAFSNGLRKCGEDSSHTVFTNNQIHEVCKCMENGFNLYQLSHFVFGKDPDQQIISLCTNIYSRKFWKEISCNYNINNYKKSNIFSEPQIEIICSLISQNKNIDTSSILSELSIDNLSQDEYEIYHRAIRNIRTGKSFKHISSKYNI